MTITQACRVCDLHHINTFPSISDLGHTTTWHFQSNFVGTFKEKSDEEANNNSHRRLVRDR